MTQENQLNDSLSKIEELIDQKKEDANKSLS
jgi:hypothetical protein